MYIQTMLFWDCADIIYAVGTIIKLMLMAPSTRAFRFMFSYAVFIFLSTLWVRPQTHTYSSLSIICWYNHVQAVSHAVRLSCSHHVHYLWNYPFSRMLNGLKINLCSLILFRCFGLFHFTSIIFVLTIDWFFACSLIIDLCCWRSRWNCEGCFTG